MFFHKNDLKKVNLSMARLLTIVNERKKLRNQYRLYLEDQYIKKIKENEMNEFLAKRDKMAAAGNKNLPMTEKEVASMLKNKEKERMQQLVKAREEISKSKKDGTLAPLLEDIDLDFLA